MVLSSLRKRLFSLKDKNKAKVLQGFFKTAEEVEFFRDRLPFFRCPSCGLIGALVRHGYTYWSHSPQENGIRGWRVRCKPGNPHQGCGVTWLLRRGDTLPRRCFSAAQLWAFMQALLDARYRHLVRDVSRPATPPVAPAAVAALYPLFRGDLRGLFKALEEGVTLLVGLVGDAPGASLQVDALRPALQRRYADLLAQTLSPTRQRQLTAWARELGPEASPTQEKLRRLWKLSQPAVSQALRDLDRAGYAGPLPRCGAEATAYALMGSSRLIFG